MTRAEKRKAYQRAYFRRKNADPAWRARRLLKLKATRCGVKLKMAA